VCVRSQTERVLGSSLILLLGRCSINWPTSPRPGATIFQYGWLSGEPTPFPLIPALQKALTIRGYWLWEIVKNPERFARALSYVYERVKQRDFLPKIAKTFRFEDVVEAYRYMESNEHTGKIVLTVD
jgi:NADPH:quinone reductase-like Zn-dependent oxidoreductase